MKYNRVNIDARGIFYRETGNADAPALLLLHGFPTSSHMFRDLMPRLADRYHVVAPDLPGFGFSDAPARAEFKYTFDNLARVMQAFAEKIGLRRFGTFSSRRLPSGNTPMGSRTSHWWRRSPTRWTPRCWPGPAMTRFSSTCSSTMRTMWRSIRSSRPISAPNVRRCWRFGGRTIPSSCRPAPRRSSGISRRRMFISTTPAISRWKHTPLKLRLRYVNS